MTKLVNVETGEIVPTLEACEAVITAGLATFIEVGNALMEIRERKLFRSQGFRSFDEYVRERWQFDKTYASRVIGAAEVANQLPIGNKPANEAQARALAPLKNEPKKLAEAMTTAKAATNGAPTAKDIAEVVADLVEEELDKAAQAHEDRRAINDMNADAAKAGLDTDADRQAQRGGFARLCRDIAALPSPPQFLTYQAGFLRDRHRNGAVAAHAWLTELLDQWEPS